MPAKKITTTAAALLVGLAISIWAVPRGEESAGYPKKPVTLVVAYSPGGAVDNVARTVGKYLEAHLGQRVVVQNKPGAGGEIGYRSLALAQPDGYTLGMITSPPVLMLGKLREGSDINMAAFDPLARLQSDPVVLAVNARSDYQTLADLVRAGQAQSLNVAGDGPNSNNQLQLVVAEELLGVDFNFVPYSGSGPSITSLLGDQVAAAVPSASSATTYVQRGDLRVLAVFSTQRYEYLPDAPTIFEASGIDVPPVGAAVRGVVLPKGVSVERKRILSEAFANVVEDPAFREHVQSIRLPMHYGSADVLEAYLADTDALLDQYMGLLAEGDAP